jgi:Putative transposase/Transposase zinc-binding domain
MTLDHRAMAVTLQGILQASFAAYAQGHKLPRRVWRAAQAVMRCRTAALGGHVRRCPQGHVPEIWYNSCRHRACPRCCARRIGQWLDGWQEQLLPTDHFHVVFTLPSELHELWRWNRAVMTAVLLRRVRATLGRLLGDPKWLGATPGVLAALHTWGRTLALHPHVHCLVTGGGLDAEGQWRVVTNGYLLPVAVVRALFRGKMLGAIEGLWTAGQLRVPPDLDDDSVRRVLVEAARQQWNIRIAERYTHGWGVAKYLARYVRGGPIKDHRLVAFDGQRVTFRYGHHRALDDQGKPRQPELTLSVAEFLDRWSEHVPLSGMHMVRAWGLYASTQRRRLEHCREELPEEESVRKTPRSVEGDPHRERPWEHCRVCRRAMVVTQVLPRAGAPPPQGPWAEAA